jgi:hypothetical protein
VLSKLGPFTLVLCSVVLSACSQYYYDLGPALSRAQVPDTEQQLVVGDVLRQFGPPLRVSATASGYVMAWEHWDIIEEKLGFGLNFAGADLLSVDWGSARARGEFLLLGFNHDHQLTGAAFTEWNSDIGGGRAIQPLGGLVSVVDVDDLLSSMPQHLWGAGSLETLPVTLNNDSRLDTGQNGIEQRGTPTIVGQHSLEME